MRKLCLVGGAKSTRTLIPSGEWEVWSLLQNHKWLKDVDCYFEIHDISKWGAVRQLAAEADSAVYTAVPDSENEMRYPVEDIVNHFSRKYFKSTFDYMMALALYEHDLGREIGEIQLPGFEFHGKVEYAAQLPSASYWIGQAEGRGIRVAPAEHSAVLKGYGWDGKGEGNMYAYEDSGALKLANEKLFYFKNLEAEAQEEIAGVKADLAKGQAHLAACQRELDKIQACILQFDDMRQLLLRGE